MSQIARDMGIAVYPGAIGGGGGWGGSSGERNGRRYADITGHVYFATSAPLGQVMQFYLDQYRQKGAEVRRSERRTSRQAMLFWEDSSAGYVVFLYQASPLASPVWLPAPRRTSIMLCRTRLPVRHASATAPPDATARGVPPEELGLPVYPGATVDYSGWVRGDNGRAAAARLEVTTSSASIMRFYQGLTTAHGGARAGFSSINGHTVELRTGWDANGQHVTVTVLHPSRSLPALIWLQRGQDDGRR